MYQSFILRSSCVANDFFPPGAREVKDWRTLLRRQAQQQLPPGRPRSTAGFVPVAIESGCRLGDQANKALLAEFNLLRRDCKGPECRALRQRWAQSLTAAVRMSESTSTLSSKLASFRPL